jgi:hypothetical protein
VDSAWAPFQTRAPQYTGRQSSLARNGGPVPILTDAMTTKKTAKTEIASPYSARIDRPTAGLQNKDAESILDAAGLAGQLKKLRANKVVRPANQTRAHQFP